MKRPHGDAFLKMAHHDAPHPDHIVGAIPIPSVSLRSPSPLDKGSRPLRSPGVSANLENGRPQGSPLQNLIYKPQFIDMVRRGRA